MSPAEAGGLRVGFLIDRWQPSRGGAEAAMSDLAGALASQGAAVHVFAAEAEPDSLPEGGTLTRVDARGLTRARRERNLAHALVEAARPLCDVTVGMRHLPAVDVYWPHGGGYREALRARRRSRGRELEHDPGGRHAVFLELERSLLAQGGAKRVVCVSELVRDELAAAYPPCAERLVVIENGVDLERFHPRERETSGTELRRSLGVGADVPLLTFCAREPVLKGLPELLRALSPLTERPWHLLAAGMKDPGAWSERATRLGVPAQRATFRAEVDGVALAAAGDLCVLPTWRDTSSLVVLESLATGTPVVTTDAAGAAPAIGEDAGSVVPAGDAEALRACVLSWLERAGPSSHGPGGRERVRARVLDRDRARWLERLGRVAP